MKSDGEGVWERRPVSEVFEFNPTRAVPKGVAVPFLSMADVAENVRSARPSEERFKGSGSKFTAGDVLMARITPCLENGKTIRVDFLREEEVAQGSTEFVVISPRKGAGDGLFAYYLTRFPDFRDYAVGQMTGTSGRQRVSAQDLAKYEMPLPSVQEQRRIAWVLGSLDNKIELNKRMAQTLEDIAAAIFRARFIDFDGVEEFEESDLGPIPKGWRVSTLGEEMDLRYGKALPAKNRVEGDVPVYGSSGVVGWHDEALVDSPGVVVGRKGTVGTVNWVHRPFFPIDTTFYVEPIGSFPMLFLYFVLRASGLQDKSTDSAVPGLNRDHALSSLGIWPPGEEAGHFCGLVEKIFSSRFSLLAEATNLSKVRDELLPRLIYGQIRVPEGVGPDADVTEVAGELVGA